MKLGLCLAGGGIKGIAHIGAIKALEEEGFEFNAVNICNIEKELLIPAINAKSGKVFVFNSCNINYENSLEKYVSKVNIGRAVRASCTYPLVFSPCPYFRTDTGKKYTEKCTSLKCIIKRTKSSYDGEMLLDGGIKENVPYKELKK